MNDDSLRNTITDNYRKDETVCVDELLSQAQFSDAALKRIAATTEALVLEVRNTRLSKGGVDAFLNQYDLSSEEGIALMCLAEALLRIPDKGTRDLLIRDKIAPMQWSEFLGKSNSLFVNAATFGLMLTGKILSPSQASGNKLRAVLKRFVEKTSEPVIREAVGFAMKILGQQFVMGETIESAIKRAQEHEKRGYRYSYDMLGEAARTMEDAKRYFNAYQSAIEKIGQASQGLGVIKGPGISVKLSALHPRYEYQQRDRMMREVVPLLKELALQAKACNIGLTVDAEEADRLDLSLDIIEAVYKDPALSGWEGFGLAVQAYQKRAPFVVDWLIALAKSVGRKMMVRLVKGAYWDSEIKWTQMLELESYPVYTRKISTDVSYLVCAQKLLDASDVIYPQFATHNAYSLAAILEMAGERKDFEFQCLHGMGFTLYDQVVPPDKLGLPCRVYAPVGGHEDLLAYLVRRLLENGANTSFVNRIIDDSLSVKDMVADPIEEVAALLDKPHPNIPLPRDLYGEYRKNSQGIDLSNRKEFALLNEAMQKAMEKPWRAAPTTETNASEQIVFDPSDKQREVGRVVEANEAQVDTAVAQATAAFDAWDNLPVTARADILERMAELFSRDRATLIAIAVREGGKTLHDAIGEVREAIDFCYYYANQARKLMPSHPLPGPTGETNALELRGRGVIVCISPWNFPLAIFTGQIVAALVTGNTVIAKPAEQTPLMAAHAVTLMHEAGVPLEALHLLPGKGEIVGARLVADARVKGVIFTGSTETARLINHTLSTRPGPFVPFIAETGGQNAMIVDSSACLEQVVLDVVSSAFNSAGQRCSALRVLYVQTDIAEKFIQMLAGAMAELQVGNPDDIKTDVGPVIDEDARNMLQAHVEKMKKEAKLIYQVTLPPETKQGTFFAPCAFELDSIAQLQREVFGPVLHVIRYPAKKLPQVLEDINHTGYGLTCGVHSRIDETIESVRTHLKVGNMYVNRNMIGAVVGVQPFGGEGLSGTGPKAGGPHYLPRLCTERTFTVNTTAAGGNASLLSLGD